MVNINEASYVMLVLYNIGVNFFYLYDLPYNFNLTKQAYENTKLFYSKQISTNVFISQGDAIHRNECEKKKLKLYFFGENYYRYKRF